MLQIRTLEIAGFASAVQALRLPFGKECRSEITHDYYGWVDEPEVKNFHSECGVVFDNKDLALMANLAKNGDEHAKTVRGIMVYAEISAPIWFFRELETYRIGRERLSCESTMHIECRGLSGEELEKAKDEIPMGHIQKTVDMISYQTLRRIYKQRKNHRLPMWHQFCAWIETLPFFKTLIMPEYDETKKG